MEDHYSDDDGTLSRLSFCDFSIYNDDYDNNNYSSPRKYSDSPNMFEFLIDPDFELDSTTMNNTIVFCGKSINPTATKQQPKLFTRDPHNGLFLVKTNSFKRSNSLRSIDLAAKPSFKSSPATASCRFHSPRKHKMALIGSLSKPQPKMVLSDIKKRQGRLAHPAPLLFPVNDEGGEAAVEDGGSRPHKSSLLRPLRCRSHFVSALMKASFGCIPSPRTVNGHPALT